jgi:hypothetical protein
MSSSVNFWVGLNVHKDSVTAAVSRDRDPEPLRVDRLPHDLHRYAGTSSVCTPRATCVPATKPPGPATWFSARSSDTEDSGCRTARPPNCGRPHSTDRRSLLVAASAMVLPYLDDQRSVLFFS